MYFVDKTRGHKKLIKYVIEIVEIELFVFSHLLVLFLHPPAHSVVHSGVVSATFYILLLKHSNISECIDSISHFEDLKKLTSMYIRLHDSACIYLWR